MKVIEINDKTTEIVMVDHIVAVIGAGDIDDDEAVIINKGESYKSVLVLSAGCMIGSPLSVSTLYERISK